MFLLLSLAKKANKIRKLFGCNGFFEFYKLRKITIRFLQFRSYVDLPLKFLEAFNIQIY